MLIIIHLTKSFQGCNFILNATPLIKYRGLMRSRDIRATRIELCRVYHRRKIMQIPHWILGHKGLFSLLKFRKISKNSNWSIAIQEWKFFLLFFKELLIHDVSIPYSLTIRAISVVKQFLSRLFLRILKKCRGFFVSEFSAKYACSFGM